MNTFPIANADAHVARADVACIQRYARIAGALLLISIVAGYFGEVYVPSKIMVSGDAMATARNVTSLNFLFRIGFASYLVEAVCDVALTFIFYVLLRPVQRDLALFAAFFALTSTAVYAVAELFYFAAGIILRSAPALKSFPPDQLNGLAFLSLKVFASGGGVFMVFYGIASVLRGYLIFQSGYLPRFLGVLLIVAGLGFVANNVALVLTPTYASDVLLLPMFLAGISLTVWFLVKGVDGPKWTAKFGSSAAASE